MSILPRRVITVQGFQGVRGATPRCVAKVPLGAFLKYIHTFKFTRYIFAEHLKVSSFILSRSRVHL